MIWSISSFKEFQNCELKWFLNEKLASRSPKDAYRQEVYFLSQLESVDAWRGKIVDYTISEFVIPKFQKKQWAIREESIAYAKELIKARYNFAITQGHKVPGLKKTEHYYEYGPLFDVEYQTADLNSKLRKAWEETVIAINNFFNNESFIATLKRASYLIPQRTLQYSYGDFTIKGVPDLIAFFPNEAPHIYDWKVHFSDTKTYTEQLLVYASALIKCWSHKDFEEYIKGYKVYDIKLSEFQLLTNKIRNYTVTDDYIERINDYIAGSIEKMTLKKCDKKFIVLTQEHFERTQNLDTCLTCSFKKICKD